ncbi:unnamed protein product [Pieris macdunnoughi]|uniref:Integrase catalytic domain-containing protein n=1 Tax=Pieris macdunnoughi TaxID=345717 RepID=A0A821XT28_9NEOP|nr:unnamed protein product [Pieris macdunnoughi]
MGVCTKLGYELVFSQPVSEKGNNVTFESHCYIYNQNNEVVAIADVVGGVYKLRIKQVDCLLTSVSGNVWHRRFGHLNSKDLNVMRDGAVKGMSYSDKAQVSKTSCIVCCEGKQSRLPFSHVGNREQELLKIVHADICGPMEVRSIGGMKYFLLFVDDFIRMAFVYFLKTKDEVFSYSSSSSSFKTLVENQTGRKLKVLRSDNGTEFCSKEFENFLAIGRNSTSKNLCIHTGTIWSLRKVQSYNCRKSYWS